MSKKVTKVEEEFVPYVVVELLSKSMTKLKAPLWEDICKFKDLTETLDKINAEKNSKHSALLQKYMEKFKISDLTELKDGSKELAEINKDYIENIVGGFSSIPLDSLRVFSKEDFYRVYNPDSFTATDAVALSHWLVK